MADFQEMKELFDKLHVVYSEEEEWQLEPLLREQVEDAARGLRVCLTIFAFDESDVFLGTFDLETCTWYGRLDTYWKLVPGPTSSAGTPEREFPTEVQAKDWLIRSRSYKSWEDAVEETGYVLVPPIKLIKNQVLRVQRLLLGIGYDLGESGATGEMTPETELAVTQFREKYRAAGGGQITPKLISALESEYFHSQKKGKKP